MSGISIVLCCNNSVNRIAETLQAVIAQEVPHDLKWEVILVDNNSSDNTAERAREIWNQAGMHGEMLKVVDESRPGLTHARMRGVKESSYDLLLFCDDDNHLEDQFLKTATAFMRNRPEIGVAGCFTVPKFPIDPGPWIKDFYGALAIGDAEKKAGYAQWVFGAGMVIRKAVFSELRKRDIQLILSDRTGKGSSYGGDVEICMLAAFSGFRVYYEPTMKLGHSIARSRLSKTRLFAASIRHVFPLVYLYMLDRIMHRKDIGLWSLGVWYVAKRIKDLFYFLPRVIIGNHKFYSICMCAQSARLILWMLTMPRTVSKTVSVIRTNLYPGLRNTPVQTPVT